MTKPRATNALAALRVALRDASDPKRAKAMSAYFKTGPGEYAEGDVFIGISMPALRAIARTCSSLTLAELDALLSSRVHEERSLALMVLVRQFEKGDAAARQERFDFYLAHLAGINNWDLVDMSAPRIVGTHLIATRDQRLLPRLARSKVLWERRVAMLATLAFITEGDAKTAFAIAELLLGDTHDLMHKAVGWMLREVGKRVDEDTLRGFLTTHAPMMPRTALRYAIERFSPAERKRWLGVPRARVDSKSLHARKADAE